MIATIFQRLAPHFRVQHRNGTTPNTVQCERKSDIQDGCLQTGSTLSQLVHEIAVIFDSCLTPGIAQFCN
jgi:hypothetical protein